MPNNRPTTADAMGAGRAAGQSGAHHPDFAGGKLWTCGRCFRNNEARLDACHHCRAAAPQVKSDHFSRGPVAHNPFERYIARSGPRAPVASLASTRTPLVNTTTPGWNGDGKELGWDEDVSVVEESEIVSCNGNLIGKRTHGNVPSPDVVMEARGHDSAARNRYTSVDQDLPATETTQNGVSRAPAKCRRISIDPEAAKTWIYPVNYPVREYQLEIVTQALYKNTLVSLPTGLGKTLIAAVVMYNFYRWFPEGKVVFLAPTKPLVAQQISACYDVMGIPERDTAELQGSVTPEARRRLWDERRVFYCTPQSMVNDIKQRRCDPGKFVCVVVDEAHRATGNYAYVNVIREVAAVTPFFRVLALSATPGSDIKTIQQVLLNLRISHIECRSEDDPEVARHTHARQVEIVKCRLGSHIDAIRQGLVAVLQPLVSRMVSKNVLYTPDPMALKAWTVIQCLHKFRRVAHEGGRAHMAGEVEAEMGVLTKVVQAKDTLVTHGASGCLQKLVGMEFDVSKRGFRSNAERRLMQHPEWAGLMKLLRQTAENSAGVSTKHPKLIKLKGILLEHFSRHQGAGRSTRAIVFTHLRDSVEEITDFLAGEELLRVKAFIGQGNSTTAKARAAALASAGIGVTGKDGEGDWEVAEMLPPKQRLKGQTQKEQKAVVKAFFAGEFNCLVATCIAEEGLDIGEVDLIVSFDALNSPVRMVQRMGRTGRKRAGKVVVLVTEGAEESKLRNSNSKSKSIMRALQARKDKFELFQGDDPMVPPGPRPFMVKKEMVIVEYHLSQVGGHQRKASRRGGSGGVGGCSRSGGGASDGGGGNGTNGGTDGSGAKEDWRLTPAQNAVLAEAYSEEPGMKRYIPDPASGWRRQKSPWSTGRVQRSVRSRLLCEMKAFVAHEEWEILYDPASMELALDSHWRRADDEEKIPPAAAKLKAKVGPGNRSGVDGGHGDGGLTANRRRFPVEIGDSDDERTLEASLKTNDEVWRKHDGDSVGRCRTEAGDERDVEKPVASSRGRERRDTKPGERCRREDGCESSSNGSGTKRKFKPGGEDGGEVVVLKDGSDLYEVTEKGADDGGKGSVGGATPTSPRAPGATPPGKVARLKKKNGGACDGKGSDEAGELDGLARSFGAGDTCSQLEDRSRRPPVRDGVAEIVDARPHGATAPGSPSPGGPDSGDRRNGNANCGNMPYAQLSASVTGKSSCLAASEVGERVRRRLSADPLSASSESSRPDVDFTAPSGPSSAGDDATGCSSEASKGCGASFEGGVEVLQRKMEGRWECGCGCRMQASAKRCAMCGGRRPQGYSSSPTSTSGGSGSESAVGGVTEGVRSSEVGNDQKAFPVGVDRVGDGLLERCRKPRCTSTSVTTRILVAPDSGVGASAVAAEGRWRCSCGSEYAASRTKCRACGAPRPKARSSGGITADAVPREGSTREDRSKECRGNGGDEVNAKGCSIAGTDAPSCGSGVGVVIQGTKSASHAEPAKWPLKTRDFCAGVDNPPADCDRPACGTGNGTSERDESAFPKGSPGTKSNRHGRGKPDDRLVGVSAGKANSPVTGARKGEIEMCTHEGSANANDDSEDSTLAEIFPSLHRFRAEESSGDGVGGGVKGSTHSAGGVPSICSRVKPMSLLRAPLIDSPPTFGSGRDAAHAHKADDLGRGSSRFTAVSPPQAPRMTSPSFDVEAPSCPSKRTNPERTSARSESSSEDGRKSLIPPPPRLAAASGRAVSNGYTPGGEVSTPGQSCAAGDPTDIASIGATSGDVSLTKQALLGTPSRGLNKSKGVAALEGGGVERIDEKGAGDDTEEAWRGSPEELDAQSPSSVLSCRSTETVKEEIDSILLPVEVSACAGDSSRFAATKLLVSARGISAVSSANGDGDLREARGVPDFGESRRDVVADADSSREGAHKYVNIQQLAGEVGDEEPLLSFHMDTNPGLRDESERDEELAGASHVFVDRSSCGAAHGVETDDREVQVVGGLASDESVGPEQQGVRDGGVSAAKRRKGIGGSVSAEISGGGGSSPVGSERRYNGSGPQSPSNCSLDVHEEDENEDGDEEEDHGDDGDDDDDVPCGVCGDRTSKDDDPIVLCDGKGCRVAVHPDCYGIEKIPVGSWFCDPCAASSSSFSSACTTATVEGEHIARKEKRRISPGGSSPTSPPACVLCGQTGGALKISRCMQWAHVVCVWWTPELATEPGTVRPRLLSALDPERASLTCSVCHELGGSAVQCAVDSCMEAYHPFCAMGAKVLMREINGIFELFCRTHSKLERAKAKEGGRREVGAAVGRVGDAAVSREREEENAVLGEDTVFADQNDRHLQRSGEAVRSAPDGWSKDFVADGGSSVRHPRRDRATASGSGRMKDVGDSPDVDCPSSAGARATHSILRGRRAIVLDSRTGDSGDESRVAETVEKKTNFEDLGGVDERREELDEGVSSQEAQAVGGRDDGGKERGRDAGTPHKIFDMAPPPTPHRRPPSRSGRTEGDEHRGEQHQERGKTAAEGVDRIENLQKDSTLVSTPSRRISRSVGDGVGSTGRGRVSALVGGDDLVTLSQAVSPEDAGRLKKEDPSKRRRLMKCATADDATNRRAESKASKRSLSRNSGEEVDSSRRLADQASDDDFEQARVKTKGSKRRSYNYERTSYRRFIEVEADVDSGVSDDDEVELDTYYDSQDSFVNDGPISYETSSSQEDGAPGSLRGSQEGANGLKGSELDEDGEGDDLQGKRGKRQEGGKRRIGDGDEKGMYLQLLARTQSPPKRGNHLGLGRVGKRTLDARGGSHQGEGGRFAFVNAVMRHARDGGDPMDIEDACASDTGYASTDQTPASKTETERDSVSGLPTTESRGTISAKKSVRECASDAEAMYSQALLQAHPGSPMSPTLSAISPVSRRTGVINAGRVEKENCRPSGGLEAKRSGKGGLAEDVGQVTKGRMDVDSEGKAQGKQEPTPKQDGRRATAVQDNGRPTEVSIVPPREKVCSTNSRYSEAKGVTGLPGNNLDCLRSVSSGSESGGATGTAARCDPPQPQGAGKGAGGCGKGVGLTEQQRQQMLENREKALARLRQKQAAKGIAVRAGALPVPAARSAPELPSRGADVSGEGAGASAAGGVISYAGRQLPSKFGTESSVGGSRAPESGMGSSSGSAISRMRPSLDATAGERGMAVAPQVKPRLGLRRSRLSLGQNKVNSKGMNQPVCSEGEKLSQGHNGRRTGESASSGTVGFGCKDVNGRSQESKGHASLAPAPSGRFSQMQGATPQRERFRMTMTMDEDSDEDSDYVSSATGKGTAAEAKVVAHRDDSHQKSHRSVAGGTSVETKAATTTEAVSCRKRGGLSRASTGTSRSSSNSISPTPALPGLPQGRAVATVHSSRQTTAPSEAEAKERVGVTTVPLSAPRAAALEVLALELRSRPGIIVHACPLGGGLRDVDIVVGSQCAVCVRTRRQVLSQTHSASSPSRSPPSTPPCSELLSQGIPPLVALLENSVRRYTRMVLLVVRGLEGAERDAMDGGEEERDAVSKVEAVRGVSVLSSRGWKQAADRILELVDREERADVGLPREVTGPGLSAAQAKFMTFLLKAPTLSYSGGLFLLKAFRGRSVKDVIASSAKEFQASVPGMSAQQAAKLKRFLVSSGASPLNRNKSAPVRGNAR